MKLFKYIITGVLGMQLLTSCVDYLDKESDTELTLPMVFEDKTVQRVGLPMYILMFLILIGDTRGN